jgi:hypothetical protein
MQPIVVRYTRTDTTWTVTASGYGRDLGATTSGIIEARDRADELVKEITSTFEGTPIVVHLLDDSAIEFTQAYLAERLFLSPRTETSDVDRPESSSDDPRRDH